MYINDIHILYYVLFGFIGIIIGQFTDWCVIRLSEYKKVISKDFFKIYLKKLTPKYILMFINAGLFIALLYTYGLSNIKTYAYMLLVPMLITVILIDYKKQIIPNRLTLTIFELGLIFSFIQGISNLNAAIDSFIGMIVRSRYLLIYYACKFTNFWERSNRVWRCKISRSDWLIFGVEKYNCYINNIFFYRFDI